MSQTNLYRQRLSGITVIGIISIFLILGIFLWGCPVYKVWQQTKEGEAELKRAEQNRQIKIQEAEATYQSSALLAQADTVRAHGIARSNQIIGQSITKNYLNWFFIDNLEKNNNVIYIPTEANMPILEAGKRGEGLLDIDK